MSSTLKFLFGCGGVYASFIGYGLFQEKLYRHPYPNKDNIEDVQKFHYPFAIIFIQLLFATIISFFFKGKPGPEEVQMPFSLQVKQGLFNTVSMLGSNTALQYVSYPVQALFKSCKVLSVLIVGLFLGQFKYRTLQYVAGFVVTLGIVGFNLQSGKTGGETSIIGILILIVSLLSDGMLADTQNIVRKNYKPSSFQLMYVTSKYSMLLGLAYGILTGQIFQFSEFIINRPSVIFDLSVVSLSGSVGQVFIFYVINNFGPNVLAIVTTTRKLFTVLASIVYYSHPIEFNQWICIFLVFVGVGLEFLDSHLKKKDHSKETQKVNNNQEESKSLKKKQKKSM